MSLSVIICTRNRYDDLVETLHSILLQQRLPDELVIVDSSDKKTVEDYLKSIAMPFPVKYVQSTPGLTLQRNIGIGSSIGDILCFFDDDVDLGKNYLLTIENIFLSDTPKHIGAVGGRITNLDGNSPITFRYKVEKFIFKSVRDIFGLVELGNGKFRLSGMPTFPHRLKKAGFCETLTGCCMAFRREVFNKIKFDENLPGYGLMEDVDISKQTLDSGYKIFYEPAATLLHKVSPHNRLDYFRWGEMSVVNYDYLFRKSWSKENYRWLFYYWALVGLVVVNLHNKKALLGTLSGLGKLKKKDIKVKGLR
jgi:GT2 family glycosyltransferase